MPTARSHWSSQLSSWQTPFRLPLAMLKRWRAYLMGKVALLVLRANIPPWLGWVDHKVTDLAIQWYSVVNS